MPAIPFGSIVMFAATIFIIITALKTVKRVSQAEAVVIERLGKYHRTLRGGLHVIVPFIDQVVQRYNLQEQISNIPPQEVITKDNVSIKIDGVVYLRIQDPQKATYEILSVKSAIANLAQTTLRSQLGKMDLEQTLSSREELNQELLAALDEASDGWGAKVTRVEISDISVPDNIRRAMDMQLEADRRRRATETDALAQKTAAINLAEGYRQETILKAEGEKEAGFLEAETRERLAETAKVEDIKKAEAQKESLELIARAISENPSGADFILNKERIHAFEQLAQSDSANKVIVPYETKDMMGMVEMFAGAMANRKPSSESQ